MRQIRLIIFVWLCVSGNAAYAQVIDGEFNGLSAKERSRIAKAEEEGASHDTQYQAIMAQAENLFRDQHFDKALERFSEARDLRPYNVYPRVKIQDLQALIARREEAEAQEQLKEQTVASGTQAAVLPTSEAVQPTTPVVLAPSTPKPAASGSASIDATSSQQRGPQPQPARAKVPADTPQEGERIYKEGRAVVVERSTVLEGKLAVFRKVVHPWGETMFFRDGASITERAWNEVFGAH